MSFVEKPFCLEETLRFFVESLLSFWLAFVKKPIISFSVTNKLQKMLSMQVSSRPTAQLIGAQA